MKKGFLVFPHQLFEENLNHNIDYHFFLIEDYLYFEQYNFHKQKLILHRASMKYYENLLKENGFSVSYIPFTQAKSMDDVFSAIAKEGITEIHYYDVTDDWLQQKISKAAVDYKIVLKVRDTP